MNTNITQLQTGAAVIGRKKDFAQHIRVSPRSVDQMLANGMPHMRISNRMVRINFAEATQWLEEHFRVQRRGGCAVLGTK